MQKSFKGHRLLADVNMIRGALGHAPVDRIRVLDRRTRFGEDTLSYAACCPVLFGPEAESLGSRWPRWTTLRLSDEPTTLAVAEALREPCCTTTNEVLAPASFFTVLVAWTFRLVFFDGDTLRGWIDPQDAEPRGWNLNLTPGYEYPSGQEPSGSRSP